ncbi:MAG: hypothetical protein ACXACU_15955, partial [Candidatus Hodarchaeales archaeon]
FGLPIGFVMGTKTWSYEYYYSLNAGEYRDFELTVTGVPVNIHINFTCDDYLNVYVFNDSELTNWLNNETSYPDYFYRDISSLDGKALITKTGTWWVVLDNADSITTSKSGHLIISNDGLVSSTSFNYSPIGIDPTLVLMIGGLIVLIHIFGLLVYVKFIRNPPSIYSD